MQTDTTYKAKWEYKLAKDGYDNTWAGPGDEGYHKYYYTYQTNINCREFEVKPNIALDKNNNKWCVLVFEGESNRTISDIQLRVCGWDSEDNYWFARNWSETFTLTKDVPFKLVSLINLSEGVDIPDEIDNSDYHATLMKEGLQFEDEEPILPYLKVKLYVFDSETAANQAIANGL